MLHTFLAVKNQSLVPPFYERVQITKTNGNYEIDLIFPLIEERILVLRAEQITLNSLLQLMLHLHHLVPEIFYFVDVISGVIFQLFVSNSLCFSLYVTVQFVTIYLFLAVRLLLLPPGFQNIIVG